ncbi:hypothetical protein, partial [uncultured Helicobacter sp.]|uniref:hypothetical protein n=1 Tax=uncultured Helicobacter sp. TaxID=175537 RepID=UPI002711F2B8
TRLEVYMPIKEEYWQNVSYCFNRCKRWLSPPSLPLKDISLTLQPMEGNYPLRYNSICKEARTIKA